MGIRRDRYESLRRTARMISLKNKVGTKNTSCLEELREQNVSEKQGRNQEQIALKKPQEHVFDEKPKGITVQKN